MTLAFVLYGLIIFTLLVVKNGFSGEVFSAWPFMIGLGVGSQFIWLDRIVYAYLHPEEPLSVKLKEDLSAALTWPKRLRHTWESLRSRQSEQGNLFSQHILFAYGALVVAFFGLTSTPGWLGKGVVLGVCFQLGWRMVQSWRKKTRGALSWLFWPIKREIPPTEQKWMIGVYLVGVVMLTLFI